jgi:hypothetical protein
VVGPGEVGVDAGYGPPPYVDPYAYPPPPGPSEPAYYYPPQGRVSVEEAVAIARSQGMARVTDIDDDHDKIEIEGRDWHHDHMSIEISTRTGEILDIDR